MDTSSSTARRVIAWLILVLGLTVATTGLVIGASDVHSRGEECGSLISATPRQDEATEGAPSATTCPPVLRTRRIAVIVLLTSGLAGLVAGGVMWAATPSGGRVVLQPPRSTSDEIAKFSELHHAGELTDDEYTAAKARVLGTGRSSPERPPKPQAPPRPRLR